jgi:hypothetical protein
MIFKKFEIKNSSRSRRGGFSHDSTLYFDGVQINKTSVHWSNRTWEDYKFKTSMSQVVEDMIQYNLNLVHRQVFPDWKRLNDTRRKELREYFKGCEFGGYFGIDLLDLLDKINGKEQEPDPVLNSMKAFLMLGDLMSKKDDTADAVKYKEKIVFATMRNKIPNWEKPKDWDCLNDAEKLERLNKIQTI